MRCKPACVTENPSINWADRCEENERAGGIPYLAFLKCDPDYVHPYSGGWENVENIKAAICTRNLVLTGELLAQKPKGSFTKKRFRSCSPEKTVKGVKTVTFNDFNADDDLADNDFWNWVLENKEFYNFGYIDCNDLFYQIAENWDLEIDEVKEDTSDGNSYYDGIITYEKATLTKPWSVPGLLNMIKNFDASTECAYAYANQ